MQRVSTHVAITAFLLTGCADPDVLLHQLEGGDEQTLVDRTGNFPEPAVTVCGQLPAGVSPIDGLVAAWAVESTFETWNSPGPYPGIRLRFSDWGFECADEFPEDGCETTWSYAVTLPADLAPGVYELSKLAGVAYEAHLTYTLPDYEECLKEGGGDGGYEPHTGWGGEIEIFAVTPDCIMGEVRGVDDGRVPAVFDANGGFVAQRCQASCVPTLGYPC